jgi:hypothetical protein
MVKASLKEEVPVFWKPTPIIFGGIETVCTNSSLVRRKIIKNQFQ